MATSLPVISFDPRDGTDNGLTVDRAQELGEQFCKEHFPGHQALVCTHPDGHNHSGNIHVHIVINSLRIYEVPLLPYMDRPADTREGCKHRCTNRKPSLLHINRQEDYQPSRKYKRNDTTSFTPIRRGGMSARKQVRRNITIPP